MGKTGFEKFAEKNSAMSELKIDIRAGKGRDAGKGNVEREGSGRGRDRRGCYARSAGVKKLIIIPAELAAQIDSLKESTYRGTFTSVVIEALSEYVVNHGEGRSV